ncbi:MAG: diguanylate cyclase [Gammaproteobacteria bacterium]|nr:diguanylate cyclase [Gammaproteobacteria bacterium]
MIKPPIPADEFRRLESLRSLKLLDTPPEERFDRVTRLARRVFGVPISLVSLVDADRQWFKSSQGLEATETPRDISFCGHAIVGDRIMVVNDATGDERFCDNPLVCGAPNIRFYAGYPLNAPDGAKIGTLCLIDSQPRDMSQEDLKLLRELGRMVEEELLLATMTTTDGTTGLSNRLGFSLISEHLLAMCRRMEVPASLLVFTLTNLREIDESSGDDLAERAIVELGQLLQTCFRDSDVIARLGMDTFGVLLAGTNLDGADRGRERLSNLVTQHNLDGQAAYELELDTHVVAYNTERHPNPEALVCEAKERAGQTESDATDNVAGAMS